MDDKSTGVGQAEAQDDAASPPRWRWPRFAWVDNFRAVPDPAVAKRRYAKLAAHYEGSTGRIRTVRERTIEHLDLRPGQTVFDVACGAGATLLALSDAVGPGGRVIGIEQSSDMAALARKAADGRANVEVICDSVATFRAPLQADAVLCCYTHDVLQDPAALDHLFAQVRLGARVAVAGLCLAPWWLTPANAWVLWGARMYLTTWRGLRCPWSTLSKRCPELRVRSRHHGLTGYIAVGCFDGKGTLESAIGSAQNDD